LLDLIYRINPDLKVALFLTPQFHIVRESQKQLIAEFKEEFMAYISELQKLYHFEFWDFKEHEISNEMSYYLDGDHLNHKGACRFTKVLQDRIDKLGGLHNTNKEEKQMDFNNFRINAGDNNDYLITNRSKSNVAYVERACVWGVKCISGVDIPVFD